MGAGSSDLNRSKTLRSYRCEYWLAPAFIRIGKKLNVPHNSIYSLYFLLRLSPPSFQARLTVSFAPLGSSIVFKDRKCRSGPASQISLRTERHPNEAFASLDDASPAVLLLSFLAEKICLADDTGDKFAHLAPLKSASGPN